MARRPATVRCRTRLPSAAVDARDLDAARASCGATVPSKPSSPTTRLLPPPDDEQAAPPSPSSSRTASTRSASRSGAISRRAGPPSRSVVIDASGTFSTTRTEPINPGSARDANVSHVRLVPPLFPSPSIRSSRTSSRRSPRRRRSCSRRRPAPARRRACPRALLDAGVVAGRDRRARAAPPRGAARGAARRRGARRARRRDRRLHRALRGRLERANAHPLRDRGRAHAAARSPTRCSAASRAVLLDEFHERHLQGDVALALLAAPAADDAARSPPRRDVGDARRRPGRGVPRLRASCAPRASASTSRSSTSPRPTIASSSSRSRPPCARSCSAGLDGHVLVFLPGAAEIRRALEACAKLAARATTSRSSRCTATCRPPSRIAPSARRRSARSSSRRTSPSRASRSTASSRSSTAGSCASRATRRGRACPTLAVEKTSRASATQRAGRAGRTRPGRALRLYTKADFDARPEHDTPEILRVDLAQTRPRARAPRARARDVAWLDAAEARRARGGRGAARAARRDRRARRRSPTIGRRMLALPAPPAAGAPARRGRAARRRRRRLRCSPRSSASAICARRRRRASTGGGGPRALDVATETSDLLALLDRFHEAEGSRLRGARAPRDRPRSGRGARGRARAEAARRASSRGGRAPSAPETPKAVDDALLIAVLAGFPDRVARRKRPGSRDLALAQGGTAELAETSAVRDAPWMVAVDAELRARAHARARRERDRARVAHRSLRGSHPRGRRPLASTTRRASSSAARRCSTTRSRSPRRRASTRTIPSVADLLFERAKARGARALRRRRRARSLARARALRGVAGRVAPRADRRGRRCTRSASCARARRRFASSRRPISSARCAREIGGYGRIDELAPERVDARERRARRGSTYEDGKPPWVESYLQDFFGTKTSPHAGRVPIVLHLLAPNKRAVQVTTDLAGFWERHYPAIRKELMRKYPRHAWPEDTSVAVPMKPPRQRR